MKTLCSLLLKTVLLLPFSLIYAQESEVSPEMSAFEEFNKSLGWKFEGSGDLKHWASIEIPEGFGYLDGSDTDKLMQKFGNLPDEYEGMISPEHLEWFVLFQFDKSGYVKDDEKDDLDAAKMLKSMKENDEASNEYRLSQGLDTLSTEGWAVEPKYNESTNNLEWGVILRSGNGNKSVNYHTKLLGREGVMHVTLVGDPEALQSILPEYQSSLKGFSYNEGKKYVDFRDGDKIASYGLTGLIAGGALYGAAKLGFFAKFLVFFKKGFKAIIIGAIAVFAGIARFFKRFLGGNKEA